jgi:hypothetical protein
MASELVIVWDAGPTSREPAPHSTGQLAQGNRRGTQRPQVAGWFTLARTGKRFTEARDKEPRLVIKQRGQYADPIWDA